MKKQEKLFNVPNALTILRIILTFVVMYMIIVDSQIVYIIIVFAIAASTDWLDGRIARWFKWETEFGRKADMIADRFLWGGTAFTFIAVYGVGGYLTAFQGFQILFIMSREVISLPFALISFFSGKEIPHVRYIAKVTTFIQGFALPALMLSIFYPVFGYISAPLSLVLLVTGSTSAFYYIKDLQDQGGKNHGRRRRR